MDTSSVPKKPFTKVQVCGDWKNDWQPDHNLTHCDTLKEAFWNRPHQRRMGRGWAYEGRNIDGSGQLRCTHCNKMGFKTATAHDTHADKCKFAPHVRTKTSLIGRAIVRQRKIALQARFPVVSIHDSAGKRQVLWRRCSIVIKQCKICIYCD